MEKVEITTDFIRLDQAMKLSGRVESGAEAKILVQNQRVRVNGKICTMRGKKLHSGDRVEFEEVSFAILQKEKTERE